MKKLNVRKVSFLEEAWSEYTKTLSKFVPKFIKNQLLTRKAAYVSIAIISIELVVAFSVYWFWFKNS